MCKELTIKQDHFWRLLNREIFLFKYFNAKLQYRIRMSLTLLFQIIAFSSLAALNNECVYLQVHCDDKTIGEHAEVNS